MDAGLRERLYDVLVANRTRVLDLFQSWDEDKNGLVDKDEFARAMKVLGYDAPRAMVDELFSSWDLDGSGVLEFEELAKFLQDKLVAKPLTKAAAAKSEATRLQRPKSALALASHTRQQSKHAKLVAGVQKFNAHVRTESADPKDLANNLTRLGRAAAVNHLAALSNATRAQQAFARDYVRDGLDASERLWWAQNESRLLSFVHYGARLQHTALLHNAPSHVVGRHLHKTDRHQQRGLLPGLSSAVLDVGNPEEPPAVHVAKGRWSQMRAESPRSPGRRRSSAAQHQMRGSASAPLLPHAPSPRLIVKPDTVTISTLGTINLKSAPSGQA